MRKRCQDDFSATRGRQGSLSSISKKGGILEKGVRILFLGIGVLVGFAGCEGGEETASDASGRAGAAEQSLPVMFALPDFELTERSGEPVGLDDLAGKVWIADFIFTSCAGPCPIMTANMAKIQRAMAGEDDLRLVSVTVDPQTDTPARLRQYADEHHADPQRWLFLTGDAEKIYELSIEGFRLAAPQEAAGSDDHLIVHSQRFALVDRQGRIRGYYDGLETEELNRLKADARRLLREPATRPAGDAS